MNEYAAPYGEDLRRIVRLITPQVSEFSGLPVGDRRQ